MKNKNTTKIIFHICKHDTTTAIIINNNINDIKLGDSLIS